MLQITTNETTVTTHDLSITAKPVDNRRADYHALRSRIIDSADKSVHWMCKLAGNLRRMRNEKIYQIEYTTWEAFCNSLQIPGFDKLSYRRANQLIAALDNKERWAKSEQLFPILDEVMKLPEGVVREITRAPEEAQPEIAKQLIDEGDPSIKKAKALAHQAKEDSVPTLEYLMNEWRRVGEVNRLHKYKNGFMVYNRDLIYIDHTFQSRQEAWDTWLLRGENYIANVENFKRRLEEESSPTVKPEVKTVDISSIIVAPNSCIDCVHREASEDVAGEYYCRSRNFPLGADEDKGADCSYWRIDDPTKGVALFDVSRAKTWAIGKKPQRPYASELEAIAQLLDALAMERVRTEENGDHANCGIAASRIADIGRALRQILEQPNESQCA